MSKAKDKAKVRKSDSQPPDAERTRRPWTSLIVSGSVALTGCPSDAATGGIEGPLPDAITDGSVIAPDGLVIDGGVLPDGLSTNPVCVDSEGTSNPLKLEPDQPVVPSDEPLIFWATVDGSLANVEHELEVTVNRNVLETIDRPAPGIWRIKVMPGYGWDAWGAYEVKAKLTVKCADGTLTYERERYFCRGDSDSNIVVEDQNTGECSMVCDPMPPPPDTECPPAFTGGVTLTAASDTIHGDELLEVVARLDEQYKQRDSPQFFTDIGRILQVKYGEASEYRASWSMFDAKCETPSGQTGKLWVEWPVECLEEPGYYGKTGYIYGELDLCVGTMEDAYVLDEGQACPLVADPMPAPACPDKVLTVTTDKDVFNIAETMHVQATIDPAFVGARASLAVEVSEGQALSIQRDCEAGTMDFDWQLPLTLSSEKSSGTIKLTVQIHCAEDGAGGQSKVYEETLDMCVQPDGTVKVNPQVCSLFPLSRPVHAQIQPLQKQGLAVALACEHGIGHESDVTYRWSVTDGHLSAVDTKRVVWVLPKRTGSYLIQSFAVDGEDGLGTDSLTVNVFEGVVRSIQRV